MDLAELVADVNDITEPESMEKLLAYLDERRLENEEFMTELLEKITDTSIYWEHPWYQECPFFITRPMKLKEGKKPFRTDSFNKAEDDIISSNWRELVKEYNIPDKPQCFATWRNRSKTHRNFVPEEKVRQFVTAYLARGLERNLYQVYGHVVRYYGAPVKGDFTEMELKIMKICYYHCPTKAAAYLADILGREPRGIRKRWQEDITLRNGCVEEAIKEKKEKKKKKEQKCWTLEEASKFLHLIIKHTGLTLKKLQYKEFPKETWLKIEKEMDHHYEYLLYFWKTYLHVQLFARCDVKLTRLRRKILKILSHYPYQVWTDIRWSQVLGHLPDGFTCRFLRKVMQSIVQVTLPQYRQVPLDEVISHIWNKLKSLPNRRLRTLELNESGQLQVVRHKKKFFVVI